MRGIRRTVMSATTRDFNYLSIRMTDLPQYTMYRVVNMREIEFCMKYADNCKPCPLNEKCEKEYQREMEQKSGECGERPSDLQILRSGSKRTPMPTQKEPTEKR